MALLDRFIDTGSRKARTTSAEDSALLRRVSGLQGHELSTWIDNALASCGRNVQRFLRDTDDTALIEAESDAAVLLAMIREMRSRQKV